MYTYVIVHTVHSDSELKNAPHFFLRTKVKEPNIFFFLHDTIHIYEKATFCHVPWEHSHVKVQKFV